MKKYIFTWILILNVHFIYSQSNFSNGFSDGYKKGFCHNQGIGCMTPLPPIAPIPRVSENMNSYQDGYNRGFETGLNSQKSSNNNNTTRERFKAQSVELAKNNIYQGPDNSLLQQSSQLATRLLKSAMQNVADENYDEALQNAEELSRIGVTKESEYCIKSRVYTARDENPIEAYNYGIYARSFCCDGDNKFEKKIRYNMEFYLSKFMINEDYKNLEIAITNIWYENDYVKYLKALSYYYQKDYNKAKKYFKKCRDGESVKEYLESIENKTVLPNLFLK